MPFPYYVFLLFPPRLPVILIPLISLLMVFEFLVLFLVAPFLLPLATGFDNIFPLYMIWMLLLFYRRVSYLAVPIVECSSVTLARSILPHRPAVFKLLVISSAPV